MRKILYLIFISVLFITSSCIDDITDPTNQPVDISITNIIMEKDDVAISGSLNMTNGEQITFKATALPSNHTKGLITWTSSNTNIVSVSTNGGLKARSIGNTTITASADIFRVSVEVTVTQPATNITIDGGDFTTTNGLTNTLIATVSPANHTDGAVTWTSANANILTIDSNGNWNAIAPGSVIVTAILGSISNNIDVTVLQPSTNITIDGGDFTTTNGITNTLVVAVLPSNHTDGTVTWTSANTNILTIDANGNYTANSAGTVTVTASVGSVSNNITIAVKGLATNITVSNYITNNQNFSYSNLLTQYVNRVQSPIYAVASNLLTNIFLSNVFNSNQTFNVFLSNLVTSITTNVIGSNITITDIDSNSYLFITNYYSYTTNNFYTTNYYTNNITSGTNQITNTNWIGWDFSGANLSNANLSNANLSNANLSNANLSNVNLSYANLIGVDLSYANLSGADLIGANLSGADLIGANLCISFSGFIFNCAIFSQADLRNANLSNAIGWDNVTKTGIITNSATILP